MRLPAKSAYLTLGLRLACLSVPVIALAMFTYRHLVVSGELTAEYTFQKPSPFISQLRPPSRLKAPEFASGFYYQTIQDQPVYFDFRLPRFFPRAVLELEFKNFDQPIFEIGGMVDKQAWAFDLTSVDNGIVNFLFQDKLRWSSLRQGDTVLFQKQKTYASIDEFINDPPAFEHIAVYNYPLNIRYTHPGYAKLPGGITINRSLRGTHRLFTYIKNEPLHFRFLVQDVNRHAGDDYVSIELRDGDEVIYSRFIKLDENTSANATFSLPQEVELTIPDLAEGAYRIDLITSSDDIFIRRLLTDQDRLVFAGRLYLGDNVGYSDEFDQSRVAPTHLFTTAKTLGAHTTHVEGLQTIAFEDQIIRLDATHQNFYASGDFGINEIIVPRNDVQLEVKGVFAFDREQLFQPELTTLADGQSFNADAIDYVIVRYPVPELLDDGWKRVRLNLELGAYDTSDEAVQFVLSLPYMTSEAQGVAVRKISIRAHGQRLDWAGIKNFFYTFLYGS